MVVIQKIYFDTGFIQYLSNVNMIIVPLAKLLMSLVLYIKCINQFKFKEQYNVLFFFFEHSSSGDGGSEALLLIGVLL